MLKLKEQLHFFINLMYILKNILQKYNNKNSIKMCLNIFLYY